MRKSRSKKFGCMKQAETDITIMTQKTPNYACNVIVVNTKSFVGPTGVESLTDSTLPRLLDQHGLKVFFSDSVSPSHFCEVPRLGVFLLPSVMAFLTRIASNTTLSSFVIRLTTVGANLFLFSQFIMALFVCCFLSHAYHCNTTKSTEANRWPDGTREAL